MNGGELIAKLIRKEGVEYIFTLCGGHISPILVGAKHEGLRVIDVRQEPTAVFAADATARLTGIPGVAVVTAGPGVTNSITAIKNAQMAQSPIVVFGGAPATALRGKGALQDIEQMKLMESLVKWSATIRQDCDIVSIVTEAFDVARSGVPGPVFVECPVDLLYDEDLVRQWYLKESDQARGFVDRVTRWYLRRHVDKLFACAPFSIEAAKRESVIPFTVNKEDLAQVLPRIKSAARPLMIVGSQAMLHPESVGRLSESLRKIGIPVYLTGMARGLLGAGHPLQFRHGRRQALRSADLVIICGMPCDFRLNYGRDINREAFHVAVNRGRDELRLNRKPDLAVQADPCTFLLELAERLGKPVSGIDDWIEKLNETQGERNRQIDGFSAEVTEYANPIALCKEIDAAIGENSIIVGDGGDFIATAAYTLRPRAPLSWLDPGPYGTLGVGAGFALAAKLVRPEAEVWLLYGDGAAGYGLIELDTFFRHGLSVIAVIGNDAGWTQISRDQEAILKDDVATKLRYNNYHLIADALDARGYCIKHGKDIGAVLDAAKQECAGGRPVLVNTLLGRTDFRKGSISM
jgi:acetolactate synthase-1/2/3 large subunit